MLLTLHKLATTRVEPAYMKPLVKLSNPSPLTCPGRLIKAWYLPGLLFGVSPQDIGRPKAGIRDQTNPARHRQPVPDVILIVWRIAEEAIIVHSLATRRAVNFRTCAGWAVPSAMCRTRCKRRLRRYRFNKQKNATFFRHGLFTTLRRAVLAH